MSKLTEVLSKIKNDNLDDIIIDRFTKIHGLSISEEYKYFLKEVRNIEFGTLEPYSVIELSKLWKAIEFIRSIGVSHDWIPFCEDNGDYYCLLPDGTVRFWDHNGSNDEKWDSLADWVEKVWIEEELED